MTPESLVQRYRMERHPEGGYFTETYRSTERVEKSALPERFGGTRHVSTAIYFLLVGEEFSSFHRIKADELWHFYTGDALDVHMISPEGVYSVATVGPDPQKGHSFQHVVPAGYWFASRCTTSTGFSFVGCTVAPGFDFDDFELAKADELVAKFPAHDNIIRSMCRQ
jgi:predicted cupin superfamily sugar epimerase